MSHTTKISNVDIKDEQAIIKAVDNLRGKGVNIELKRDQKARLWYESQSNEIGKCDYVLSLPGTRFDVGLKKNADGVFVPYFDQHANIIGNEIGGACALPKTEEEIALWNIGAFSQEYAKEAAINAATAAGYYVESATTNTKGEVELVFVGM